MKTKVHMFKNSTLTLLILFATPAFAGPVLQMDKAFIALSELIPFITDRDQFMEKKNEKIISSKISELQSAIITAKHDSLIKEDLFAPSYSLINENISGSREAFKNGNKDYARWRLKEITTLCLDCHTRLPASYASSFQNGEFTIDKSKFENIYNLGVAQLIVRRYTDAKDSFTRSIQDRIIKKEFGDIILPFKQILLIDGKVLKNPENLSTFLTEYSTNKALPEDVQRSIAGWLKRLNHWKGNKLLKVGLKTDKEVTRFIAKELAPLKGKAFYGGEYDVDLLITSGLLSNYSFENPTSASAPEINFWLGWSEKYLKRENFFGSGDLFLKQCIKRYPTNPIAKKCLEEYKESVEFEFSGSSGTSIPKDVQKELDDLAKLIKTK
jgi:hypothetical protein